MTTKLTITLPEELRRRVKAVAAMRADTVSEVIRKSLEAYVAEALEEAEDTNAARDTLARIAAGQEYTYSNEEVWAEIERLERAGVLPD